MASDLLNALQLKNLNNKNKGEILNDGGGLRGRVRINRSGKTIVLFEYRYRVGHKQRTAKVGNYPDKSLADIRKAFRSMKEARDNGIDPITEREREKLETQLNQAQANQRKREAIKQLEKDEASRRTVTMAVEQWQKVDLQKNKNGGRKDSGKEVMRMFNKDVIPAIGNKTLSEVTQAQVVAITDAVIARGSQIMAYHLFTALKQFFSFAESRGWIEVDPIAKVKKTKAVGKKSDPGERYLSETEITELHHKLPNAKLPLTTETAFWIMLATCCRVGELSKAEWQHINFDTGEWFIPVNAAKNSKAHTIYLSNFAFENFHKLYEYTGAYQWCLPNRTCDGHIHEKTISKQVRDRTRSTPLPNRTQNAKALILSGGTWTPHDLRRTGATLMRNHGISSDVVERCLNHRERSILIRTYQHKDWSIDCREAWRIAGETLSHLITPNENAEVIPFKKPATQNNNINQ